MTTELAPYNWLRKVPSHFVNTEELPLFGNTPQIDWNTFSQELANALSLENLKISATPIELKEADSIYDVYKESETLFFQVAPLKGLAALVVSKGNFDKLLTSFADKELHHHVIDEEFRKAFIHFIFLEVLAALHKSFPQSNLSPQLVEEGSLPEDKVWASEIEITWNGGGITSRFVIPDEMRSSWKARQIQASLTPNTKLLETIPLTVQIEAGRTLLPKSSWETIKKGDYLILDRCFFTPGDDKGRVILSVHQTPIFRAKIKNGSIKILETPQLYELGTTMAKNSRDDDLDEETEEMTEEFEDTEEYTDEETDTDSHDDDEDEETETPTSAAPRGGKASTLKVEEIPLDIVVEVGRFQMTVQKLSELQPGTLLDLNIRPEEGVDLVVNGTCIAKGELLKVGETLGVRILDIPQ